MQSITPERWARIEGLLDEVFDRAPADRAAYLDEACAGDPALRREVERLVEAEAQAPDFLDAPAADFAAPFLGQAQRPPAGDAPLEPGAVLGAYRVVREIGRGGMSTVYLAERADGQFEQRVAIKLLRQGAWDEHAASRLRAERQILASMDHPHIARVFDGGVTPEAVPYLVMEYVEGVPITTYCERNGLSVAARLALFATVCEGVQYAHQNLVVHRDLKPSNILVTSDGRVKLLDFGIAKLIGEPVAAGAPRTQTGVHLMTPAYAAPEQVEGAAITTSTDVYALGVVLYEMLVGCRPYAADTSSPYAIMRAVCETEPLRPSTAASQPRPEAAEEPGSARRERSSRLRRRLRGDVDAVVLKALRKDPAARYPSAAALAGDVRRYLDGLPVTARRGSVGYRAGKFVRRHRWGMAMAALVLTMIGGFAVTMVREQAETARALRRAESEAVKSGAVTTFLMDLFEENDPNEAAGDTLTALELLRRGEARAARLDEQPAVQAGMLDVIARVYTKQGRYEEAEALSRQVLEQRIGLFDTLHVDVAASLEHLGDVVQRTGRYAEAESLLSTAARVARQVDAPLVEANAYNSLGHALYGSGDYARAEAIYRQTLALRRTRFGDRHPSVGYSLGNTARALMAQGRLDEAEPLYRRALDLLRELLGPDHSETTLVRTRLAQLYIAQGDLDEAEPLVREALRVNRGRLGPRHPRIALDLNEWGTLLARQGAYAEAEPLFREALAIREAALGRDHPDVALSINNLSYVLLEQGEVDVAVTLRRRALEIARARLGEGHLNTALFTHNLAVALARRGDVARAEVLYREAVGMLRGMPPEGEAFTARSLVALGRLLLDQARPAAAEPVLREALALRRAKSDDPGLVGEVQSLLGACLAALGQAAEAEVLLDEGLEAVVQAYGAEAPQAREARARRDALRRALRSADDDEPGRGVPAARLEAAQIDPRGQ